MWNLLWNVPLENSLMSAAYDMDTLKSFIHGAIIIQLSDVQRLIGYREHLCGDTILLIGGNPYKAL